MASTITLADSLNWCTAFVGYRPLNIGTNNEPALTSANIVKQVLLGPPFTWNFNRDESIKFLTTAGTQDYAQTAATFGFIEKAGYIPAATITNTSLTSNVATYTAANSFAAGDKVTTTGCTNGGSVFNVTYRPIVAATATQFTVAITNGNISSAAEANGLAVAGKAEEISQIMTVLGKGTELGAPASIAPQIDNNSGTITFRLLPIPNKVYQITIIQQKRIPALMTATSSTWTPIPDHYAYIYSYGLLSLLAAYDNNPIAQLYNQKFVAHLLGASQGLSQMDKNIFQKAWLDSMTEMQTAGLNAQQSVQARGS